jgi:hypothetical protein
MVTRTSDKQTERGALSGWDNEGGAPPGRPRPHITAKAPSLKAGNPVNSAGRPGKKSRA